MTLASRWAAWLDVQPRRAYSRRRGRIRLQFVATRRATLRTVDVGDRGARAIVFACDPPNVIEHYEPLLARLQSAAFRVVCLELPGFGFSRAHDPSALSLEGAGTSVAEALIALQVERATLVFPCVTGFVALGLAARRPDLVANLVLSQFASWSETLRWIDRLDRRRWLRAPLVGQLGLRALKYQVTRSWYDVAVAGAARRESFLQTAENALEDGAGLALASLFQSMVQAKAPRLEPVHQPTLLLWDRYGVRSHRRTDTRSALSYFAHSEIQTVSGAGHFPDLEHPDSWLVWLESQRG